MDLFRLTSPFYVGASVRYSNTATTSLPTNCYTASKIGRLRMATLTRLVWLS